METIYDHNPTATELEFTGNSERSREWYIENMSKETAWSDLAFLFNSRGDSKNEIRAWGHIPFKRDQFFRGFDVIDLD